MRVVERGRCRGRDWNMERRRWRGELGGKGEGEGEIKGGGGTGGWGGGRE